MLNSRQKYAANPVWAEGKECQSSHHRSQAASLQHPEQTLPGRSSLAQHTPKSEFTSNKCYLAGWQKVINAGGGILQYIRALSLTQWF